MNPYGSALVRGLVESGELQGNILTLREEYGKRLAALDEALKRHLPAAEYTLPQGGFFFWVRLPGLDASKLRQKAKEFKVDFRQGELFSSQRGMKEYLRLGFCFYGPTDLEEGIKRLAMCLGN